MQKSIKILISNDDGVHSKGLKELIGIACQFGEVVVVAPHLPRSGMSSAITVETPIRLRKFKEHEKSTIYCCTGTPVDCVKIAFSQLFDEKPDLVLSGINHGSNSSISIHYSGTMGAVIEGCIHDVPSIGFSLCDYETDADFTNAKSFIATIISETIKNGLPFGTCLNVNIPKGLPKGIKICTQGDGKWVEEFEKRKDPHNGDYYWLTGHFQNNDLNNFDADINALHQEFVSIVPIKIDCTDSEMISNLKSWNI